MCERDKSQCQAHERENRLGELIGILRLTKIYFAFTLSFHFGNAFCDLEALVSQSCMHKKICHKEILTEKIRIESIMNWFIKWFKYISFIDIWNETPDNKIRNYRHKAIE